MGPHRHKVYYLSNTIRREEAGNQDVRLGPVKLLFSDSFGGRRYLEASTLFVVEYSPKHTGRIKIWDAEPINRPVHPHQGHRSHIPNDTVILDWLIPQSILL